MDINVNDRIRGFLVTRVEDAPDCRGTLYEMVHEKTGAGLVWLKRPDENKTFCIGFKTIPEDDSGVFHICEHSVLNGSRKYPVREPFVDLLKSSLQTFLNALTYPDKTIYPVSSRNDKDFLNLMDVYLDAVLHPAIYTNPNIFYQEGWHYEIRDPKEEPVFKGVVLNEMKGAFSSVDEVLMNEVMRQVYSETCYKYVSGGDPEKITDLTYEQFLAAHTKFYHPSNSRTVLDGDLDIDAALAKIDSFFAEYDNENMTFETGHQDNLSPTVSEVPYEIGEDESEAEKTEVALTKILCDYDDVETQMAWRVLSTMLTGSNEAPLKKAILENRLGQDADLDVMDELAQPYLGLVVRNTEKENAEKIRQCMHDTAAKLLEDGLRKEELKAILNQMEFRYREQSEPAGVKLAATIYQSWMYGGDPAMYISVGPMYEALRQKADTDYFENLIRKDLLDTDAYSLTVVVPDKTLAAKRKEKESAKLKAAKESWQEDVASYVELNHNLDLWQAQEDTPEQKATLPALQRSDVDPLPKPMEPKESEYKGVPVLLYPESDNGIVYLNLYFNLAGITKDHLSEVSLMTDLFLRLRTARHTLPELQELIRANIGSLRFRNDAFTVNRDRTSCYPVLAVHCSVLKQNVAKAVELIQEVMTETQFEKETILPILQQYKEQSRQMFIGGGHAAAVMRVGAQGSAESVAKEYFSGYESFVYTSDLIEHYEEKFDELKYACGMYCGELFSKARMTISISGEDHLKALDSLLEALPVSQAQRAKVHYPLFEKKTEGIQVPAQISYAVSGNNLQKYDFAYSGVLRTVAQILTYGYLWNEIRVKGGAYGTGFAASRNGNVACYSYRDPSPANSLKTFEKAADYIEDLANQETDLTSYIIGTIAANEPLLAPGAKITLADASWFCGVTYDDRVKLRKEILDTSNDDLRTAATALRKAFAEAESCVVASAEALEQCGITEIKSIA